MLFKSLLKFTDIFSKFFWKNPNKELGLTKLMRHAPVLKEIYLIYRSSPHTIVGGALQYLRIEYILVYL